MNRLSLRRMIRPPVPPSPWHALRAGSLACCLVAVGGCASWPQRWGGNPCAIESKPTVKRQPIAWHLFDVTVLSQIEQAFHWGRLGRRWAGVPVRALNLRHGRITQSAFYVERDIAAMTPEAVRWGPSGPDDAGAPPFTITKPKTEGKTPGFFVTDARGRRYLFKLDPVEAPELLSGAEVVTSKLLFALGYRVPSYEITQVRLEDFTVREGATAKDASGAEHPFTAEELGALLAPRAREGVVRVAASRLLEGELLGPARFKRFRDCAELRALRLAYAWVNNIDTKDHNSLLVWTGRRTEGYLIDFGTSLGADAGLAAPKTPCEGWRYVVDLKEASLELLTLGAHHSGCDPRERPVSQGIGLFSPHFDPDDWKPYAPNLAFEEMNADDARWIAKRLDSFSRAQLEAAVSAGHYSNPEDAAYLAEVLDLRRQAILDRYLSHDADEE